MKKYSHMFYDLIAIVCYIYFAYYLFNDHPRGEAITYISLVIGMIFRVRSEIEKLKYEMHRRI